MFVCLSRFSASHHRVRHIFIKTIGTFLLTNFSFTNSGINSRGPDHAILVHFEKKNLIEKKNFFRNLYENEHTLTLRASSARPCIKMQVHRSSASHPYFNNSPSWLSAANDRKKKCADASRLHRATCYVTNRSRGYAYHRTIHQPGGVSRGLYCYRAWKPKHVFPIPLSKIGEQTRANFISKTP